MDTTRNSVNGSAPADTATINDMIEVLNDGKTFYTEASQDAVRPDLKQLFTRMADHKRQIAEELGVAVQALGDAPATSGSVAGSMRKMYAELRTKMTSDKNHEYIAQLEEFEDRILHTFEAAATDTDDAGVSAIASKYMKSVQEDHDLMRDLKKSQ
jgi:uncharacterized protein (TIGR02284 family)